ncbi:unnamed protein product [Chrysodeixis includens]|uniref:Uncharacterized protein n=1 Tax=Chrysodeixis includens TaxID=689277 RepID=A0A9P0FSH0_CHRIL|nr:unnamed protein product [Chrysodeixis includens]
MVSFHVGRIIFFYHPDRVNPSVINCAVFCHTILGLAYSCLLPYSPRVPSSTQPQPREGNAMLRSVSDSVLCVWHVSGVGYTMRDIRYHWKDGLTSVGMSNEVQLPQFRVLGHRQRATVVTLTTGNRSQ